jgi:hypothetical protein
MWAGQTWPGLPQAGPTVALIAYGQVVTVSAIISPASRTGVDLPWSLQSVYAHVGLDLTGANGGVVRIDDIVVEDVTEVFIRKLMDWVDVRDYGALGQRGDERCRGLSGGGCGGAGARDPGAVGGVPADE